MPTEFETDRARFIGRGRTLDAPAAMSRRAALSDTTGPVLDPIVCLRQSLRIPPGGTARLSFTTAYADNEEAARRLIDKYHDRRAVARALALASTHSQVELRHLGLTPEDTLRFQRLAGRLLYGDPRLRAARGRPSSNARSQADLWKYGISGDLPILLVRIAESGDAAAVSRAPEGARVPAHQGLAVRSRRRSTSTAPSYLQDLQDELQQLVESGPEQAWIDRPGGVFLRRADLMPDEDQIAAARRRARASMAAADGGLLEQLKTTRFRSSRRARAAICRIGALHAASRRRPPDVPAGRPRDLEFFNGHRRVRATTAAST